VEIKGGSRPLTARKFILTSNLSPRFWYPELDGETLEALMRRLNIIHVTDRDQEIVLFEEIEEEVDRLEEQE